MAGLSAERKLSIDMLFSETGFGFSLAITDETGARVIITKLFEKERAKNNPAENIRAQLSKLGNTPFEINEITVDMAVLWFVPSSLLGEMRREAIDKLLQVHRIRYQRLWKKKSFYEGGIYSTNQLDYTANVANQKAIAFYKQHGVQTIEKAFELEPRDKAPLMYTKHCLRYSMGWCPVHHRLKIPHKEPFYLLHKQTKLRLAFDCNTCRMLVYLEK